MQTTLEVEDLLVGPQPLTAAANEEFAGRQQPAAGWDPFEVWRTRVKAAQRGRRLRNRDRLRTRSIHPKQAARTTFRSSVAA